MSMSGDIRREYDRRIEVLTRTLQEILSMPFKSNKPHDLNDAVETAMRGLKEAEPRDIIDISSSARSSNLSKSFEDALIVSSGQNGDAFIWEVSDGSIIAFVEDRFGGKDSSGLHCFKNKSELVTFLDKHPWIMENKVDPSSNDF